MNNTQTLKLAESYLGKGGSTFRSYCGLPSGAPWCCAFVRYIFDKSGNKNLFYGGKNVTYCPTAIKWCDANLAKIPIYLAMPSDIIFFDWQPNNVPDHIGFVRQSVSATEIKTIEGNTNNSVVAYKTRPAKYIIGVYRPHFTASYKLGALEVDGICGYSTIANLQKALGVTVDGILGRSTVKALQKKVGVTADGAWGAKTSKAVQKMVGTTADGLFGVNSVKALQKWINSKNKVTTSTPSVAPSNGDKIVAKAKALAWASGTAESKWAYKTGSARDVYKTALKKHMGITTKIGQSDCGYFVSTCVRASGISKDFVCLKGAKESFPSVPSQFKIVHKGSKVSAGTLKAGDIVRYKKTGGSQHTYIVISANYIAEAGRKVRFPVIRKMSATSKCNASDVKHSTIQVIRAK